MAPFNIPVISVLFFALFFSGIQLSTSQVVKGKVSCLDCTSHYDFSGISVLVKCDQTKKLFTATDSEGSFEVELPRSESTLKTPTSLNCMAVLLGGSSQLYATRANMVSKIVKADAPGSSSSYTTSTALAFSTTRPSAKDNSRGARNGLGSSKNVDLPLPREWGLAPSSYYFPVLPIIGIP